MSPKEENELRKVLLEIKAQASNPKRKKYAIENLVSKANLILNKSSRRVVKLTFEPQDLL